MNAQKLWHLVSLGFFALCAVAAGQDQFAATATARVDNGFVVEITVTFGGTGYSYAPAITILGGLGAEAQAIVTNGSVKEIRVTNAGSGYTTAPQVIINPPPFPFFSEIQMVPRLSIRGLVGSVVQIRYTEDLGQTNSWKVLTNLVINHSPLIFVDVDSPPAPQRFYRVINLSPLSPSTDQSLLVWIPPGSFKMGSPPTEQDRVSDEGPQTGVTITRGFWCSKYEVTQAQFEEVTGTNPSHYQGDFNLPVENITRSDAMNYCAKLTDMMRTAGLLTNGFAFRLPTEAEWEYACRAGTTNRFSFGDDPSYSQIGDYAWFADNSANRTHPVGQKLPNPWGLFDMHGNVQEFCLDRYAPSLPGGNVTDPTGPTTGTSYVRRGGLIGVGAQSCRSASRMSSTFTDSRWSLGFRVVLAPSQP